MMKSPRSASASKPGGCKSIRKSNAFRPYCFRNALLFLMLLQPPGLEALALLGDFIIVALNPGAQLAEHPVGFLLELLVVLGLASFELFQRPLLDGFESIERAIAPHSVLDNFLDLHTGGIER